MGCSLFEAVVPGVVSLERALLATDPKIRLRIGKSKPGSQGEVELGERWWYGL